MRMPRVDFWVSKVCVKMGLWANFIVVSSSFVVVVIIMRVIFGGELLVLNK